MLTDKQRTELRGAFLRKIDRLMQPGVKIADRDKGRLARKREVFATDEQRVPGDGERSWVARLMINAGLQTRRKNWATLAPPRPADHHPEASAPAKLQGSRKETPMADWLRNGTAAPLRPPARREAVAR